MNQNIEAAIRRALGDMGVKTDEQQDTPQQPQHVPIEAVLSAAIGDRPVIGSSIGLNQDRALAAIIGADTLEGKPLK